MTKRSASFEGLGADGIGSIVLDRPDDAVNALSPELTEALAAAIRAARATPGLRGLILRSAKPDHWLAGADLKLLSGTPPPEAVAAASRRFQAVADELAWLPATTVAAINGTALGAGLELALACDYRVAADRDAVRLGQPEVNLGLVPAGGGTQRLPRLVGLQRALDLILSGRRLNAERARRAGLVDEVVHPSVLETAARAWAARPKRPLHRAIRLSPSLTAATELAEQTPAGRALIYRQARASVLARTHGHYPAPLRALQAVEVGIEQGMAAGLEVEARAFAELATTPTAQHLIWLFGATQRQRHRAADARPPAQRLGVVGAGFMGSAIAEVAAANGLDVRLRDTSPQAVGAGLGRVQRIASARLRGRPLRDVLRRVSGTTDWSGFGAAQLVIEAVFEDLDLKRQVVRDLEARLPAEAVIASNTSALPIAEIARGAAHPERIVGMHFFSPAERMPLLEVVRPAAAADRAVELAAATGARLGKTVIVVADAPGFYTSRILGVLMNEAALLLGEGASMEQVDAALVAFGFPVGPFVLYDEVGLDVALHAGQTLQRAFGSRLPPSPLVPRLVEAGARGRRSGLGFYRWPKPGRLPRTLWRQPERTPNPAVRQLLGQPPRRAFSAEAIQDRLVLLLVNEAVRCLEEHVIGSPTDGDLGAVLGLGFPPFRGGPFHYVDTLGARALWERLSRLAEAHGARYAPAALLGRTERFFPGEAPHES